MAPHVPRFGGIPRRAALALLSLAIISSLALPAAAAVRIHRAPDFTSSSRSDMYTASAEAGADSGDGAHPSLRGRAHRAHVQPGPDAEWEPPAPKPYTYTGSGKKCCWKFLKLKLCEK